MFWTIVGIVGGAVVLAILAVLVLAAMKPDAFRVERSATMQAPPERVFPWINDFHRWLSWSPWEGLDPNLKRNYTGAPSGKGTVYEWDGNKQVGEGRMEILDATPPCKILIKLDFLRPFEAHHQAEFLLDQAGDGTRVTWVMNGRQPFMLKAMTLFFSMDKMVGKDFEKGLANLRSAVEKSA